ncbi:hypothetical protein M404DRAFT_866061 [Pisolithus tinctorius Marx 270]|uniref:Uncharacterized protein n=1 Tax=Pisolithus tinctorius Marx 270 TaxID=870435 RepID=A0A0C3JKA2_PISTI|nr:hypothetical protein M404DRAFT_866061 [Pisolithus tinctorius Marx 270]
MDEITQARAELARLESAVRSRLDEMLAARKAVEVQRAQIKEFNNQRPPKIHRLSDELLVQIFGLAMVCRENRMFTDHVGLDQRRRNLVGVSRHWREVILITPILWRDIYLTSRQDQCVLESQLMRSQGVLLDVTIRTDMANYSTIVALLRHLRPTTNHWRSLYIYNGPSNIPNFSAILHELSKLEFPALADIYIQMYHPKSIYLVLQRPLPSAPALKHLTLQSFVPASPLETPELEFEHFDIPPLLLFRTSSASIITLSLTGNADVWMLGRNTIHFPLLEELLLNNLCTAPFLEAIIAPKLEHFHLMDHKCQWEAFSLFGSKFSNVYHLDLTINGKSISADVFNGIAFCQAFPNTRHAEFSSIKDLHPLVTPIPSPGKFVGSQTPANSWASLESLGIFIPEDFRNHIEKFDQLTQWLEMRQESGLPKLHVKFTGNPNVPLNPTDLSLLFSKVKNRCILEYCLPLSLRPIDSMRSKRGEEVLGIW